MEQNNAYLRLGQILLLRPVRSTFYAIIRQLTCSCFSYQNDPMRTKRFVSQVMNRSTERDNVPSFPGSCFVVNPTLCRLAKSLTFRGRAFNTAHQALSISSGPFLDKHSTCISLILCFTKYTNTLWLVWWTHLRLQLGIRESSLSHLSGILVVSLDFLPRDLIVSHIRTFLGIGANKL